MLSRTDTLLYDMSMYSPSYPKIKTSGYVKKKTDVIKTIFNSFVWCPFCLKY